jgi:hypothetical protein
LYENKGINGFIYCGITVWTLSLPCIKYNLKQHSEERIPFSGTVVQEALPECTSEKNRPVFLNLWFDARPLSAVKFLEVCG